MSHYLAKNIFMEKFYQYPATQKKSRGTCWVNLPCIYSYITMVVSKIFLSECVDFS